MPGVTEENINHWFSYHPPVNESQKKAYEELRESARQFALTILRLTPSSADQTAAIRKVREAVMTSNAAIACEGK